MLCPPSRLAGALLNGTQINGEDVVVILSKKGNKR